MYVDVVHYSNSLKHETFNLNPLQIVARWQTQHTVDFIHEVYNNKSSMEKFSLPLERSQMAEKKVFHKKIKVFPDLIWQTNKQTNGLKSFLIIFPRLLLIHALFQWFLTFSAPWTPKSLKKVPRTP
jgi:hypothetical protein